MKNEESNDSIIIANLEDSVEQKITLLKCLSVMYTSAIKLLEEENYDSFLEKLDQQEIIQNSIDGIEIQIKTIAGEYTDKNEIHIILSGKNDACVPHLKKLSDDVLTSHKLLKNCKALNEKLTYRVEYVRKDLSEKMVTSKNRRIINTGYSSYNPSKVGLLIDC